MCGLSKGGGCCSRFLYGYLCLCLCFSWGMIVARWCRKSAQKWASMFVFDARLFFARLVNEHPLLMINAPFGVCACACVE